MPPREVDLILGKFPGPVTLHINWRKKLLGLALSLGFAVFCVYILLTGFVFDWYETMMAWISVVVFGALAVRAVILLLAPGASGLTLDADGFAINHVFHSIRSSWRDVSGFRVEKSGTKYLVVMYDVLTPGAKPRDAPKDTRALPDNYGLPADDLAWLLEQWRERALMEVALMESQCTRTRITSGVPGIGSRS